MQRNYWRVVDRYFGHAGESRTRYRFFRDDFLRGTFAPERRACDRPIAIACLRLLTFWPERPLFSFPRLRSCIAFFTFSDAFLPYLAMVISLGTRFPYEWLGCVRLRVMGRGYAPKNSPLTNRRHYSVFCSAGEPGA